MSYEELNTNISYHAKTLRELTATIKGKESRVSNSLLGGILNEIEILRNLATDYQQQLIQEEDYVWDVSEEACSPIPEPKQCEVVSDFYKNYLKKGDSQRL